MINLETKTATSVGGRNTAKILGKSVLVIGGLVSGALSMATFKPMAKRLNNSLNEFYMCNLENSEDDEVLEEILNEEKKIVGYFNENKFSND